MSGEPDLREFLQGWPYEPNNNARMAYAADRRRTILVRQPMGLEQFECDGRPDGRRPHGMESALEFQYSQLAAARSIDAAYAFKLTASDCAELCGEGRLYHDRSCLLLRLKEWGRAERDTARNLRLVEFVRRHAEIDEDRVQLDQWRHDVASMNAVARAMILLENDQFEAACKIACECIPGIEGADEPLETRAQLIAALLRRLAQVFVHSPAPSSLEESLFIKQGDYWTIRYQHRCTHLKATRGLSCLAYLLRHPGREFHVSELLAQRIEKSVPCAAGALGPADWQGASMYDGGLILDAQARTKFKERLDDLRKDLEDAERLNDPVRAARALDERNAIAEQLASAVGLGGRNRKAASDAERARSTVTKRIKESIHKIAEVNRALGHHLTARIKTGCFCSYNPHPDWPVAWTFECDSALVVTREVTA